MGIVLERKDDTSVITLEGEINISSATDLKAVLLESLNSTMNIVVSIGDGAELDVMAFKLIWAAQQAAAALGVGFALRGEMPETAAVTLKDAGLQIFQLTT